MDARRILLIHPLGYDKRVATRDISRMANLMPPLGLASIAAYLEQYGFRADIVDCFARPDSDQVIDDYVRRYRPRFAGATCTTAGFLDATRIFHRIKELSPETCCLAGGPHVSALREKIIRDYPEVDYVVVGEGETPLRSLMEAGGDPQGIAGLVYRPARGREGRCASGLRVGDDGRVVFSGFQKDLLDLDALPLPAYHRLEGFPRQYQLPIFNYPRTPNTSCISSRGCPYQCSYCDRSVFRRTFRCNSADYLYRHLQTLRTQWGIRHVNFYDDQFTFHRDRVVAFCRRMIEEPLGMTFNCAVRAEHVDPELLGLMKGAGCWMISLGIETGDPDLLAQHRQNADLDLMSRTIRAIHKAGIRAKGLFMIGLPGETEQSFRRTMDYVFSLPIDDLNVAKFTPFPGSPLYESIHSLGRFEEDWEKMDCMNTVFVPHGMTAAQLESLFFEFYKHYYTRPKTLWNFVSMVWKSPDSWRRFLANAGSFLMFARANRRIVARPRAGGPQVAQRPAGAEGVRAARRGPPVRPSMVEPIAVVIPVYNQPDRLREVVRRCLGVHPRVLVVDDGSDPQVAPLVADLTVEVLRHEVNQGKGAALRTAARRLHEQGATHMITLDADGQHDPEDLPQMTAALRAHPEALILGVRDFDSEAVPGSSRFGRAFGNFWVRVQTGARVHDIQSGFRAYPVALLEALPCLARRYAFEVEVVVRALWGGVPVQEVPVHVHYAPADRRGSHFHKLWDNLRLTILNTHLTMRALLPWPHRQVADANPRTSITVWHPLRSIRALLVERATPQELMFAVALGVFLGAVPLIACHTLAILVAAAVLRLNRVVAVAASQLCMPPVVPAVCIEVGHLLRCGRFLTLEGVQEASFLQLGYMGLQCLWDWCIGSLPVGVALALVLGSATYVTARVLQRVRHGF